MSDIDSNFGRVTDRDVARTSTNIKDGELCNNIKRLKTSTIVAQFSILDVFGGPC